MNSSDLEPLPKVGPRQLIYRGFTQTCPNCGGSKLFKSTLKLHHRCPNCGMTLERGDGYYLGPLCLNYGFVAVGFVLPVLGVGLLIEAFSFNVSLAIALVGAFILPLLLYRISWSIWLMIYYICLSDELHANHSEDSDDLSFEEEKRS
ncbi:MAG: DUF983 domain-containing protein [Lentimonas sp.]